jgi:tubulin alpha
MICYTSLFFYIQGFFVSHSLGGGTGSGFTSLLMKNLSAEYGKRPRLQFSILPSPQLGSSVVDPYNTVLATHAMINHVGCSFLMDNEALYKICSNQLDVEKVSFPNLNRMVANVVSSVTASLRFDGDLNFDITDAATSLVPFPRVHFPVVGYAPVVPASLAGHQQDSIADITEAQKDSF